MYPKTMKREEMDLEFKDKWSKLFPDDVVMEWTKENFSKTLFDGGSRVFMDLTQEKFLLSQVFTWLLAYLQP